MSFDGPRVSWIAPTTALEPNVPSWMAPPRREAAAPKTPPAPKPELREAKHSDPSELPPRPPRFEPELRELVDPTELEGLRRQIRELEGALARRTADLARLRERILVDSEGEVVRLALAVAERVVGQAAEEHPDVVREWVREGIAALASKSPVVVRVSPEVARALGDAELESLGERVQVDGSLEPLGCVISTDAARVEVSASARIRAVAENLGVAETPRAASPAGGAEP